MMISTRGRYALRVMIDLAEHIDEGYIPLQTIAKRQGISEKYLESILAVLSKAGLLDAVRGKGGGYRLSKPAKEYTAFEVLSLTEGTLAPVTCLERGQQCENAINCRTLPLWQGLDQVIAAYLCSYTLADLTREEKPQPKRRRTKT
jgi:transcriptional regulator, Rrf2 family